MQYGANEEIPLHFHTHANREIENATQIMARAREHKYIPWSIDCINA